MEFARTQDREAHSALTTAWSQLLTGMLQQTIQATFQPVPRTKPLALGLLLCEEQLGTIGLHMSP